MRRQSVWFMKFSAAWLMLAAGVAAATEYTWNGGGGDAYWTNSANWGGAGYPNGDLDVALFTSAADVTLDANVTLGRVHLNGGGATVTVSGTNTIMIGQNVDTAYKTFLAQDMNDRLVICPKVVMKYAVDPHNRLYVNLNVANQGTVVFRNRVQINDHVYAFVVCNGTLEFSGDAAAGPSGTPGSAKLLMCMGGTNGSVVTCRLADRASLNLAAFGLNDNQLMSGRVYQDGTGTVVSVKNALYVGDPEPAHSGNVNSKRQFYTLNNGSLTVGSLYCGYKVPGTFLMTNGTLTAAKIIVGTLVEACEFRMTGGHMYPGSNGISLSNSSSLFLGGGTVHVTNTAWASDAALTLTGEGGDTAFETAGNTATLSGTLSGPGGLVKRGAGTLTLNGPCAFKGKLDVAEGTVTFGTASSIDGVSELVVTNGTVSFSDAKAVRQRPPHYLGTLRVTTGKLSLNTEVMLYVSSYIVDGVAQPVGSYAVGTGWVKVVNFWTGGGADDHWTNPDNWSGGGCPNGVTAIAYFTNAASVTLDADVIVERTILNGGGSTVTLTGTNHIYKVGLNNDSYYMSFLSRHANDRLVVQPEVNMYSATGPHERLYCNSASNYRGSVTFQGRLKLNTAHQYVFVAGGNMIEFSGNANVGPAGATLSSGMTLGMSTASDQEPTYRILDNASVKVNSIGMNYSKTSRASIVQEGTGTSVTVVSALYMGSETASIDNIPQFYILNSGSLSVGTLYCGHNLPGRFLMTNGTLTAGSIILGKGTAFESLFTVTGGDVYLGAGGLAYSNSASKALLGGGTVHATAAWSSSAALNLTGERGDTAFDTAGYNVTLGALDGAGGLVKTGAGTLTLGGANAFTGGVTVAGGTLAADSGLLNATNLSVTASGAVLSVGSADSLNTNATLSVAAGGLVNLAFSGTATVNKLVVNGVEKSPGAYGSGKAFITGDGSLQVLNGPPRPGTVIRIR